MTRRGLALLRLSVLALALSSGGALVVVDPDAGQDASALAAQDVPSTTAAPQDGAVPTTAAPPSTAAPKKGQGGTTATTTTTTAAAAKVDSGKGDKTATTMPQMPTIDFSKMDAKSGELEFEVKVTPACGTKGTTMTAEVKLPPGSHLSLMVMYSDGSNKGEMFAGPAAPDGSFLYPWVIPADAPKGEGKVFVAAVDPATDKSGTNGAPFRVGGTKC